MGLSPLRRALRGAALLGLGQARARPGLSVAHRAPGGRLPGRRTDRFRRAPARRQAQGHPRPERASSRTSPAPTRRSAPSYVAKSDPDGYTLFFTTAGAVVINPHMRADLPYDPVKRFRAGHAGREHDGSPGGEDRHRRSSRRRSSSRSRSRRPDGIAMASTGVGSPPHLALELFKGSSGANVLHVPYRGAAPAVTDVVGGQVHGDVRRPAGADAADQGRHAAPDRRRLEAARRGAAGRADARRAGHQGRLRRQLVRAVRAGQDARAGDRQAQRRGDRRAERSRDRPGS